MVRVGYETCQLLGGIGRHVASLEHAVRSAVEPRGLVRRLSWHLVELGEHALGLIARHRAPGDAAGHRAAVADQGRLLLQRLAGDERRERVAQVRDERLTTLMGDPRKGPR